MRRLIIAAALLLVGLAPGAPSDVAAQSFDCRRASLDAEYAICANPRLSLLDEEMSFLYTSLPSSLRSELRASQLAWLRRRNACGYDIGCIRNAYVQRIDFLSGY
jgi:uncharacterized protein